VWPSCHNGQKEAVFVSLSSSFPVFVKMQAIPAKCNTNTRRTDNLRNLFLQFIIHASTHHFPLQLSHSHRPHHYTTWRTTYLMPVGTNTSIGGTGNLRTMKQYIIKEDARDSFSLSALIPWTLFAFVRPSLTGRLRRPHHLPNLHSFPVTLCIYHPHHRSLSATTSFPSRTDRHSHHGIPSSIRVRFKVYFILHIIILFLFSLLTSCRWALLPPSRICVFLVHDSERNPHKAHQYFFIHKFCSLARCYWSTFVSKIVCTATT